MAVEPPPHDENETYHGLIQAELISLGKLVAAAGRLEATIRAVGWALRLDTQARMTGASIKALRRRCLEWIPAWATCETEDIVRWLDRTRSTFAERDAFIHSDVVARLAKDGGTEARLVHMRSGQELTDVAPKADVLAAKLSDLAAVGVKLERELLPVIRPGANIRVWAADGAPRIVLSKVDGVWAENRLTEQEIDHWWGVERLKLPSPPDLPFDAD